MNMRSLATISLTCPLLATAGPVVSDPFGPQSSPFEPRANATLLFEAADRQTAMLDQVDQAYRAPGRYRGGPTLHFGALPDNLGLLDPLGPMLNQRSLRFLSSAEFEKKVGRAVGILTVGIVRETGNLAGSQQSPSLAMNVRPTTTFTSASLGYALTPHSSLMSMVSYGKTEGYGNPDSLIAQVSSVRTVAFSLGYATTGLFSSQDRLGVSLSVPAKVRTGALQNGGPALLAGDPGALAFGNQAGSPTLNLRPTATERDLELGYTMPVGRNGRYGKLTGAVMWRVNPGHDANARPDWLTGVRYASGF